MTTLQDRISKMKSLDDWNSVRPDIVILFNEILRRSRAGLYFNPVYRHSEYTLHRNLDSNLRAIYEKMNEVCLIGIHIEAMKEKRILDGKFRKGKAKAHRMEIEKLRKKLVSLYELLIFESFRY